MLKKFSKKGTMLLHLGVLLLGMCVLVAAAPLTDVQAAEAYEPTVVSIQPVGPVMHRAASALESKDWWEIVRPDVSALAIHVADTVERKPEEPEILVGDVETIPEEELMVEAFGLEAEMEILGEEPTVIITPEEPAEKESEVLPASQTGGRVLTQKKAITLSNEEYNALLRIVESESGCEDIVGRILVANVILNRMASDQFPNSVHEIVTQTHYGSKGLVYQFTPAKPGGNYWSITPSDLTREAVDRALAGEDYSEGALYFAARRHANSSHMSWFDQKLTWLFQHGNHEFYIG